MRVRTSRISRISTCTCAALLTISGIAFAQRPLVYPLRSQSPGQQSVDNAYCYGLANSQTHIDMARQPQRPTRTTPINFAADAAHGASAPPLPPGATASAPGAAAPGAAMAGASGVAPTPGTMAASGVPASGAASVAGASGTQTPPLPPPEPPMTTYWRAYGDCMQARGYGVR